MPEELEQHRITGARLDELYAAARGGKEIEWVKREPNDPVPGVWGTFYRRHPPALAEWIIAILSLGATHARVKPESEPPKRREFWLATNGFWFHGNRQDKAERFSYSDPIHVREVLPGDIDADKVIVEIEGTIRSDEFGKEFVILFDENHEDKVAIDYLRPLVGQQVKVAFVRE